MTIIIYFTNKSKLLLTNVNDIYENKSRNELCIGFYKDKYDSKDSKWFRLNEIMYIRIKH